MTDVETHNTYCPHCFVILVPDASFCPGCGQPKPLAGWARDALLHSDVVGRFHIYRLIGTGGFGSVYEASHVRLGGRRAIKVLRLDLTYEEALIERFWREARALYQLNAPQLVKVEEYGRLDDGRPFMVMELAEGVPLDKLIQKEGPLTPLRTIRIAREVLLALAEAHEAGILHRDLKAENVMVKSDPTLGERVKVLDLGVLRIIGDSSRLTRDTRTLGTPEYMSPEQWRGEDSIDGRTDLYSLGILMYEMLTGDVPFPRHLAGAAAIYKMVMTIRPKPVSATRSDLPAGLESMVFRLVAREREERPPTALAALKQLERIRTRMR